MTVGFNYRSFYPPSSQSTLQINHHAGLGVAKRCVPDQKLGLSFEADSQRVSMSPHTLYYHRCRRSRRQPIDDLEKDA